MKAKTHWKNMKSYGIKSEILLDQQEIAQMVRMRNIWALIYFWFTLLFTSKEKLELYNMIIVKTKIKSKFYYTGFTVQVLLYKFS